MKSILDLLNEYYTEPTPNIRVFEPTAPVQILTKEGITIRSSSHAHERAIQRILGGTPEKVRWFYGNILDELIKMVNTDDARLNYKLMFHFIRPSRNKAFACAWRKSDKVLSVVTCMPGNAMSVIRPDIDTKRIQMFAENKLEEFAVIEISC